MRMDKYDEQSLRAALVETARAMADSGLSPGKSGNVSARGASGGMLITPTGVPYADLCPEDIVRVDAGGQVAPGALRPSSEWQFHLAIYAARPEIGAVVHCHSRHATALACARREIPAFHYMVAVAGGDCIRCAPYATFGTEALGTHAVAALRARQACLLANHGQIALGPTPEKALAMAAEVETLAAQYCTALTIGEPVLLDADEMARVIAKFRHYGQQHR